jgi:hypothetical protein
VELNRGVYSEPEDTLLTTRAQQFLSAGPADVVDLIGHICSLPGAPRIVGRAAAAPEDRQLGRLADSGERTAHDERLRAVGLGGSGRVRSVHVDDHRDAVAFGNRLAESS